MLTCNVLLICSDHSHTRFSPLCSIVARVISVCMYVCVCFITAAAGRVVKQSSDAGGLHPDGSEHRQWRWAGWHCHSACHEADVGGTRHRRQTSVHAQWATVVADVTRRHHREVWQWPSYSVDNCHLSRWPASATACCCRLPVNLVQWTEPHCEGMLLNVFIRFNAWQLIVMALWIAFAIGTLSMRYLCFCKHQSWCPDFPSCHGRGHHIGICYVKHQSC